MAIGVAMVIFFRFLNDDDSATTLVCKSVLESQFVLVLSDSGTDPECDIDVIFFISGVMRFITCK